MMIAKLGSLHIQERMTTYAGLQICLVVDKEKSKQEIVSHSDHSKRMQTAISRSLSWTNLFNGLPGLF